MFHITRQYFPPIPCKRCLYLDPGQQRRGFFLAHNKVSENLPGVMRVTVRTRSVDYNGFKDGPERRT